MSFGLQCAASAELLAIVSFGWPICLQGLTSVVPPLLMLLLVAHMPDGAALVAGVGIGSMYSNVAGKSLLVGFGLGFVPLCSQAFGAGAVTRCGHLLLRQAAMHLALIACVVLPLCKPAAGHEPTTCDFCADLLM